MIKKFIQLLTLPFMLILIQCNQPAQQTNENAAQKNAFKDVSQVSNGKPVSVMLTCYSTTLLASGTDQTNLRVALLDSLNREITNRSDSIRIYVSGDGKVSNPDGAELASAIDTSGTVYNLAQLENGICKLIFTAGSQPDKVKLEVQADGCWPGSHEIHTLPADFEMMKPTKAQLPPTAKKIDRMIGADISWLPQIEDRGGAFIENGDTIDAMQLLANHGFNYIRLRIFVNPENEKGYAPEKGYCDLNYTLAMARRVKAAGLKLLLDFHYSDYWADPQQQYKPAAWAGLDFKTLLDSVEIYTTRVIMILDHEGCKPDLVQVGNEINHGLLWPDGHIGNPDQLAELLQAGAEGVSNADPRIPVMMHIALGGQNQEAVFWLDNMIARGVQFDLLGISYYPRWHGTLTDLQFNLNDLAKRYNKPISVVEYSDFKQAVHDIVFALPDDLGKGACIWEPLNWRSGLFERDGPVTAKMMVYDELSKTYLVK